MKFKIGDNVMFAPTPINKRRSKSDVLCVVVKVNETSDPDCIYWVRDSRGNSFLVGDSELREVTPLDVALE